MSTMLLRRRPRGDDGQVVGALVLLVAFLLLALVTYVVFPLGAASNDRARARTAADAAALAGAEEMRTAWLNGPVLPVVLQFPYPPTPLPNDGRAAATTYAASNGSTVESYSFNRSSGVVEVSVRANHTTNENEPVRRATSAAAAEMDIDMTGCRWRNGVPPSPVPYGPPTFTDTLVCGAWEATYLITNGNGVYPTVSWVGKQMPQLYDDLEPRLVK
ncbi:hypothetical protein GCM10028777_34690 [Angustibacter speluncae]